jgi:hypothetical protein
MLITAPIWPAAVRAALKTMSKQRRAMDFQHGVHGAMDPGQLEECLAFGWSD